MLALPKVDRCNITTPKNTCEKKSLGSTHGTAGFLEGEINRHAVVHWLDGQGLGKSMTGKLVRKTCAEEVGDASLQMGKGCENTCVSCKCSPRGVFS